MCKLESICYQQRQASSKLKRKGSLYDQSLFFFNQGESIFLHSFFNCTHNFIRQLKGVEIKAVLSSFELKECTPARFSVFLFFFFLVKVFMYCYGFFICKKSCPDHFKILIRWTILCINQCGFCVLLTSIPDSHYKIGRDKCAKF